jgi:hypothetical protein
VGLAIEDVGICYGLFGYFVAIWYTLWPFGILYGYLVHCSLFGMLYQEKSGNPASTPYRSTPWFCWDTNLRLMRGALGNDLASLPSHQVEELVDQEGGRQG